MSYGARSYASRSYADATGNTRDGVEIISSDAGVGTDVGFLIFFITGTDAASATDFAFPTVPATGAEVGAGMDSAGVIALSSVESASVVDLGLVLANLTLAEVGAESSEHDFITVVPVVPPPPAPSLPPPSTISYKLTRWRFDDPETGAAYVFSANPDDGGSAQAKRTIANSATVAPDGQQILSEAYRAEIQPSTFTGYLFSKAQYDAFVTWVSKPYPIQLTDDLGRVREVLLVSFVPKRERAPHRLWKHSYTITFMYLSNSTIGVLVP